MSFIQFSASNSDKPDLAIKSLRAYVAHILVADIGNTKAHNIKPLVSQYHLQSEALLTMPKEIETSNNANSFTS